MKLTLFLSMLTIFQLWATETYSQLTKLTLNLENIRIADALREIENQSEFYFLYSPKLIDVEKRVDVSAEKEPIKDILTGIFGKDVKFIVYDRQVILTPITKSEIPSELQQQKIAGKVTDKSGVPLPGVNVVVTGTTVGVITDANGKYTIDIPQGSKSLTFSFIGYESQEISIGTSTQINVSMAETTTDLSEVVVTGYGTAKKATLTGAIVSVKGQDIAKAAVTNVSSSLVGTLPGLTAIQPSGEPGSDGTTFYIRFPGLHY